MEFTIIPHVVKGQTIHSLRETDTAYVAAKQMIEHEVSAIVVVDENERLIGIVTERDITRRIVGADLNPKETELAQIMTENPDTVAPDDSPLDALKLMRVHRYRHLPVVADGRVVGVISMRDLRSVMADVSFRQRRGYLARILEKLTGTS